MVTRQTILSTVRGRGCQQGEIPAVRGGQRLGYRQLQGQWQPGLEPAQFRRRRTQRLSQSNRSVPDIRFGCALRFLTDEVLPLATSHTGQWRACRRHVLSPKPLH